MGMNKIFYLDGFEDAYVGVCNGSAVYDKLKCLDILQGRDGMARDEAIEYFDFNVAGVCVANGRLVSPPVFK